MKINRVRLENYRVHENLDIEFSSGINLLLGANGKGKSSILEAIGFALFGSEQRTKNTKEAITYGKKNAKIEINFTGIDGEDYIVTRKFPRTEFKLCRVSDNFIIDAREDKIKELCGIKGDIKNIYDNIIVAKQNEFISAFKETPTIRERIFNKIFNTDIYADIYGGYGKFVVDKYDKMLSEKSTIINTIKENIEDPEEIKNLLKNSIEKRELLKSQYNENTEKEKIIKTQLIDLEQTKISYEKNVAMENLSRNKVENLKKEILKTEEKIAEAKNAQEICSENKEGYDSYLILSKDIEKIKKDLKNAQENKNIYLLKEKEKIELDKKISLLNNSFTVIENKEDFEKKLSLEKEVELKNLEDKFIENKELEKEYNARLDMIEPLIKKAQDYEKEIENKNFELEKQKLLINEKKTKIENLSSHYSSLKNENLQQQIDNFEKIKNEIQNLEKKNEVVYMQIKENNLAYNMLKSSQCPYLKEKCENLSGVNIEEFFKERDLNLNKEKNSCNFRINELKSYLVDEKKIITKLYTFNQLQDDINNLSDEIEKQNLVIENIQNIRELLNTQYENLKLKNNFESKEQLEFEKITLVEKIKGLDIFQLEKEIDKLKNELYIYKVNIQKFIREKENINENRKKLEITLNELIKYLDENKNIIDVFNDISQALEIEENKLKSLERYKDVYIENFQKAKEKDGLIEENQVLNKTLISESNNLLIKIQETQMIKEKLVSFDEDKLKEDEDKFNKIIRDIVEKIGQVSVEIDGYEKKLEKIKAQENQLKEIIKEIKIIEKKLEMATVFRNNIKIMGKEVAKNMLYKIEDIATSNFRKITGRGEKIKWSNDDSDKYAVYLVGDDKELKFEQLSGGEQVAVAISIRSAMSNLFTESKFSIFDEPTNNLDTERRQSLADSIGEILKNLEQSIIVTHDDTFREMAQRVITL